MRISDSPDDEVSFRSKDNRRPPEFKGVNVLPSPLTKQLRRPGRMQQQMPNRGELSALASRLRRVHIDESPPQSRIAAAPAGAMRPSRLSFEEEEEALNKENERRNPFGGFTPSQPKGTKTTNESKSTPLSDVSPNVLASAKNMKGMTTSISSTKPAVVTGTPQKRLSFRKESSTPQSTTTSQPATVEDSDQISPPGSPDNANDNAQVTNSVKSPVPALNIEDIHANKESAASLDTFTARGDPMTFTPAVCNTAKESKAKSTLDPEPTAEGAVTCDEPSPMNISDTPLVQRDIISTNLTVVLEGSSIHGWQERCNALNAISQYLSQSFSDEVCEKLRTAAEHLTPALISHLGESRPNVIRSTLSFIEIAVSTGVSKGTDIPERLFDEVLDLACGYSLTAKDSVITLSVLLADQQTLGSKLKNADNPARLLELLQTEMASAHHPEYINRHLSSAYELVKNICAIPAMIDQSGTIVSNAVSESPVDPNDVNETVDSPVVQAGESTDDCAQAAVDDESIVAKPYRLPSTTPEKVSSPTQSVGDNEDEDRVEYTGPSLSPEEDLPSEVSNSPEHSVPSEALQESTPELSNEPFEVDGPAPPKTPAPRARPPSGDPNASNTMPRFSAFMRTSKDISARDGDSSQMSTPKNTSPPSMLRNKRLSSARRLSPSALRKVKRYTLEDLEEAKRVAVLAAVQQYKHEQEKSLADHEIVEKDLVAERKEKDELQSQLVAERKEKDELHSVLAEYEATMSKMATDKRNSQRGPMHAMLDVEVSRLKTELYETTQAFTKLKERYSEAKETLAVMEGKESRAVEQNHELRQSLLELQKWSNDLKANTEKKLAKAFENVNQFRTSYLDRDARANKALSELQLANRDVEQQKAACAETAAKLSSTEVLLHEAQDAKASLQASLEVARASLKDTSAERNALREEADSSRLALARMQDDYDRLKECEAKSSDAVLRVASLELETRTLKADAYDQMSKMRNLEKKLEAKDKECEELNSICEELLSNLEKEKLSPS